MKVKGLDGRIYQWKLQGKTPTMDEGGSAGHVRARILLRKLFPCEVRREEIRLPGSGGLTADFVLLSNKLVVEVHGRQHYEFVHHFHGTRRGFIEAQIRDRRKRQWCNNNGLIYCELPDTESDDQWTVRIKASQLDGESDESGDCP